MNNDLSDVKVGDKLFNIVTNKLEEVKSISVSSKFPLLVGDSTYTFSGKYFKANTLPSLYKEVPDWYPIKQKEIDPYRLPRGLKIEVSGKNNNDWVERELFYFDRCNSPVCLAVDTCYTLGYEIVVWDKWRLTESTEILEEWYKDG